MISGRRLSGAALGGVLGLCALAASAADAPASLTQVMASLAARTHAEAPFVERAYLSRLSRPWRTSGVLIYRAPDHLEQRTLSPRPAALILDGQQLIVRRGHRTDRLDLRSYPAIAPYVDAIRDTLAGNLAGLERAFEVAFTGDLRRWRLELVPRDADAAHRVRRIRIGGAGADIRTVEVLETDGDRTVMTIGQPAAP